MRSGAQIVSYELSAGLSIFHRCAYRSLQISDIIASQQNGWWIFKGHIPAIIAFVIFIIAVTAENKPCAIRSGEAESELTAGFHTEYSGMKFALFFPRRICEHIHSMFPRRNFIFSAAGCRCTLATGVALITSWIIFHHRYGLLEKCFS
jgi:NADH:ubiquinone oxidoreductase subunit H